MASKHRDGRIANPWCPRFGSRRQFVVGFSGLVGSLACGGSGQRSGAAGASGAPSSGGSIGQSGSTGQSGGAGASAGANTGGFAAGGTAHGQGGVNAAGGMGATSHKAASDRVLLGSTGILASRLAMGSGSHSNDQARLGVDGFARLLTYGYEQGINFFETADAYGAHPHVAEAIRRVGRNNVVVLTKTAAQTAAAAQADLDRFRRELGVDMIDIVLLHNKQSATWTTECAGAMDVLSAAKDSGVIRAHGVSCHTLAAL